MNKDPYQILGVSSDASDSEIKSIWRALIQSAHPDRAESKGPEASAVAEAQTKRLNEAYAEIRRRREQRSPSPPKRSHSSTRNSSIPPGTVHYRDGVGQASGAVEHAEALVDRWRRHARGLTNAVKLAREAHATVLSRRAAVSEIAQRLDTGLFIIDEAVRVVLHRRLLAPTERAADRTLEAIKFADELSLSSEHRNLAALETAFARANDCLNTLRGTLDFEPEFMMEVLREGTETARSAADGISRSLDSVCRAIAEVQSACKRCRDARKRAKRAARDYNEARSDAAGAVEKAVVKSATAHGLCRAELSSTSGAESRFVVERFIEESERLKTVARALAEEQRGSESIAAQLAVEFRQLEGLLSESTEVLNQLETRRQGWHYDAETIEIHATNVIPRLMAEIERAALERVEHAEQELSRVETSASRVG